MKTSQLLLGVMAVAVLSVTSCKKDEENEDPIQDGVSLENKLVDAYVVNEGSFGSSNASITYFDASGNPQANYFNTVNNRELGDVAQSMTIANGNGYIVLNASGKVEVVDITNFESTATIEGLSYPRYAINVNNEKVLVSNGSGAGTVEVIDATTNQVTQSINVGDGPEMMYHYNNEVVVANSGGWGIDSTISVIDLTSMTVSTTVEVGKGPFDIERDVNGNYWVLCKGEKEYDSSWNLVGGVAPSLVQLDANFNVVKTISIGDYTTSVGSLEIDLAKSTLYYRSGDIYKIDIDATEAPTAAFIEGSFSGLVLDATDRIIGLKTPSYTENGTAQIFNSAGTLLGTYDVGIGPNGVVFRN